MRIPQLTPSTPAQDSGVSVSPTVAAADNQWMNSPGHKAIVISTDYNYVGVALALDPDTVKVYLDLENVHDRLARGCGAVEFCCAKAMLPVMAAAAPAMNSEDFINLSI